MKVLSLLVCLLVLSACASTPQSEKIRAGGIGSLPVQVELSDTPFYPQADYQCGPAALATVLQAHGIETTPELLAAQVYIPEREGSLQIEMAVSARRHEMLPYPLEAKLSNLFAEIAAGNPVLVLQNLAFDWYPNWHYAVVIGYDTETQEVILRSGETKRWVTPFDVFERSWQRADFWALVIVPVGEIPKTAEGLRYLKSAYAFEQTGNPELAFKAYQAASIQWPDVPVVWMTLGNMAMVNGDIPGAVKAFSTAVNLNPELINGWNNLAYALHAHGCAAEGQQALGCGLNISPEDNNLLDSKSELTGSPAAGEQVDCPVIRCD